MPDEVYLPFIDRPAEVTALLNEQPTSRLFHLLEALFPPAMRESTASRSVPSKQLAQEGTKGDTIDDPKKWTFERLSDHLMTTTRVQMDDKAWTDATRACICGRSEALWERFKGALGVPAELEVEDEDGDEDDLDLADNVQYAESESAVDLGGDADSLRHNPLSGSAGDLASLAGHVVSEREAVIEPVFADQSGSEDEDDGVEKLGADEAAAGGEGRAGSGEGIGRHFADWSTGALSEGGWSSVRVMENIGEGSDEEDEDPSKTQQSERANQPTPPVQPAEFEDYGYPHPQREIRALQITTAPSISSPGSISLPLAPAPPLGATSSPRFRIGSPLNLNAEAEDGSDAGHGAGQQSSLRLSTTPLPETSTTTTATPAVAADPEDMAPRVVLRRPSESIAQTLSASPAGPAGRGSLTGTSISGAGYRGFGGYGLAPNNRPYHPALSERGPGNPLFPSSFAGLSVAPTLVAK